MKHKQSTPITEFLAGVRSQLSIIVGVMPFGLMFGALAGRQGLNMLETAGFSLFVFAGGSQFLAVSLLNSASAWVIIATIAVVNLRHLLYSATLAPYWRKLPNQWRLGLAYLLTDEAFATTSLRYQEEPTAQAHWFMLGSGLTLWASWQISTIFGALLGQSFPTQLAILGASGLDFALAITFMALVTPLLRYLPGMAAAISAALVALALSTLPYQLGLMIALLVGVSTGGWLEVQLRKNETP